MYQYLGNTGICLYDFLGVLGTIVALIWNLCHIKTKRQMLSRVSVNVCNWAVDKKRLNFLSTPTLWAIFEMVLFSVFQVLFIGYINGCFGSLVGTGANYFGTLFFVPIILTLICFLIGMDPRKQLDILTPTFPFLLIFVKLACFCQGCCRGIEWEYGMYNHSVQEKEFPVQLVEMGLAALIFIFLMVFKSKIRTGNVLPIYIISYSATRFFSEFLRCETNVFLFLKTYQILCVIGVVYGVLLLKLLNIFDKKMDNFFEKVYVKELPSLYNGDDLT